MNAFRIFFNDESSNVKLLLSTLCDLPQSETEGTRRECIRCTSFFRNWGGVVDQFRLLFFKEISSDFRVGDELKISEMHIFLEIPRPMWSA